MKTKFVKGFLFLISLSFMVVGCQDKDYYDETNNRPSQADLFPEDVVISDDFNWSTTKTVELSVSVDDSYNGAYHYTIEVYETNPLFDPSAQLLGAGVAKANQDFVSNIVASAATSILYVQQTDPTGAKKVTAVNIENKSSLAVSFKASAAQSSTAVKTAAKRTTTITVPTTPGGAIDVTSSSFSGFSSGNSYVIPKGKEYRGTPNVDWTSGGSIFVEGTWVIPSDMNVIYYTVVVQQGGTIKFENENSTFTLGGQLIIASGATVGKNNISMLYYSGGPSTRALTNYGALNSKNISLANNFQLTNYGDLNADAITTSTAVSVVNYKTLNLKKISLATQTEFKNYGDFVAEVVTSSNWNSFLVLNEGSFTTGTLFYDGSGGTLTNNCTLVITGTLTLRGTTVNVNEGALISVSAIDSENSTLNLLSNSMIATNTAKFNGGMTRVYGQGASKALFKATTVTYNNWDTFSAYNNVVLEFQNVIDNGGRNAAYAPAVIVKDSKASVNISATSCNGNGNTIVPGVPISRALPIALLPTYTYAFEDNWPSYGDYDMNDFVTDVSLSREQNSDNKLTKLTIKAKLRGVGAIKHLGAAIQLDNVQASEVKSVTYSNTSLVGKTFVLNSVGVETGQTYAVIPLADDVHQAFGLTTPAFVNTTGNPSQYPPVELTITVEFKTPIRLLTNDDLNVFIATGGYKNTRTEIHLGGQQPTDKVNRSQFNSANLKSSTEVYRSHENLVWGLCIVGSFDYPIESEKITDVYPLFKGWAQSNGTENIEWYKKSN